MNFKRAVHISVEQTRVHYLIFSDSSELSSGKRQNCLRFLGLQDVSKRALAKQFEHDNFQNKWQRFLEICKSKENNQSRKTPVCCNLLVKKSRLCFCT